MEKRAQNAKQLRRRHRKSIPVNPAGDVLLQTTQFDQLPPIQLGETSLAQRTVNPVLQTILTHYDSLEFAKTVRTSKARDCFTQTKYQTRRGAPSSASTKHHKHDQTNRPEGFVKVSWIDQAWCIHVNSKYQALSF